ncbi:MAG: hypothetical protein WD770_05215 [Actinomycetota bacterium]
MTALNDLLILASEAEGVPPEHIAAQLAVPLGFLIFSGAVFALLWSNYGAKKGGLIYATAFFGFTTMLGIFWWFGAPGTPVAGGLQNFPGQAPDAYQGAWYGFEPGAPRAGFFPSTNDLGSFQTVDEYVGTGDVEAPGHAFISGDLDQAGGIMLAQWLPTDEAGGLRVGAGRRTELNEAAGAPGEGEERASPFYTAEIDEMLVADDGGTRVAGARITTYANFADSETGVVTRSEPVEEGVWFAFKDPGATWFPSAVWTFVSLVLFLLSLFALDRIEQREKRRHTEVEEAEDLAVPIAQ